MDGVANGLGPRFNTNQCASCHAQPNVGGSSPSTAAFPFLGPNPETQFASAHNILPSFITPDGPVREARFKFALNRDGSLSNTPDGGVHDLFVITGRSDAGGCVLKQPDFAHNLALNNVIFRIPTPVFGAGLIENIPDEAIFANMQSNEQQKEVLGISGHPNRDGNDGAIARFGWKAQNKSLEIFAGEAYNVEMGVTNELFQNERASPDEAQRGGLPRELPLERDTRGWHESRPRLQTLASPAMSCNSPCSCGSWLRQRPPPPTQAARNRSPMAAASLARSVAPCATHQRS